MADEEDVAGSEGFDLDELYHPNVERDPRYLPRLLLGALRLVWAAAPGQLVLNVVLQGVGSVALALQVLVGKQLLSKLLADNTTKDFSSAIVNASMRPLQMTVGLLSVGSSALAVVAVGTALATIEPLFLVLGLVAAVPLTMTSIRVGRALYRFAIEQTPTDRERLYVQSLLVEKDPAKEIRAYGLAPFLRQRYTSLYERRIQALRRLVRRRTAQGVVGGTLSATVSGGVLGLLILLVSDGRVSLAGAGAAAAALILLGTQLQALASGTGQLYESALFIQDFNNFVRLVPGSSQFTGTAPPPERIGHVSVRNLTFTYPSRQDPSLQDIDLDIGAGQVVALVGENGSGKTTLAKLLAGLYRPQEGSIRWEDQDLATMDISQVRDRVAVLFQDFVKYFLPARENISMGRWERSEDEQAVRQAAARAGAQAFIEALPHGYDTYLGPQFFGGSDLSGGQWQRVALARAFFRDARLVILDEPTAALDARAEAALFRAVRDLFAGRSVLLISHRFATVRLADHIYVLNKGRVVEHGNHSALMALRGLYAELFTLQASAFGLQEPQPSAEA